MSDIEGGCACGAIRFRIGSTLDGSGVCHCLDCQKASGGGPNYVALVPTSELEILKGSPRTYTGKADSGSDISRVFCPDCGTPLWSVGGPEMPFYPVKLGALDDAAGFTPVMHLYTDSAQPWHLMHDGIPRFPKMPPQGPPA